jgi:uncharacterized FlaG/YvyC family protein
MSENSIIPISNVSLTAVSGMLPKAQLKAQQVKAPVEEPVEQERSSTKPVEKEPERINVSSNVSVHFRVNDETNELTMFIVDRENKQVLRTIPASEFYKMPAGELLKLAA